MLQAKGQKNKDAETGKDKPGNTPGKPAVQRSLDERIDELNALKKKQLKIKRDEGRNLEGL